MRVFGARLARYLPVVEAQCMRPECYAVRLSIEKLVGAGISIIDAKIMTALVFADHKERSDSQNSPLDFEAYLAELAALTAPAWRD